MIPKPSSCEGCPFYTHGKYYTPDVIVPGSKVLFIAQNPGPDEEAGRLLIRKGYYNEQNEYKQIQPQPLIGATGKLFNEVFLPHSGLQRSEVSLANAIRCRPGKSLGLKPNSLPNITTKMHLESSKADIIKALKHCRKAHLHIPSTVETVVTMGRYAMFSLTGIQNEDSEYKKKIGVMESWRGYAVDSDSTFNSTFHTIDTSYYHTLESKYRIFFTMHIAALFEGRNRIFYHATLEDFHKIKLLMNHKWPEVLPSYTTSPPTTWPKYACFDTEFIPNTEQLTMWSLTDTEYNNYVIHNDISYGTRIPVVANSTILMQNALADVPYIPVVTDINDLHDIKIEDMMLGHVVLYTGEPHGMNYIASIFGTANRWKHLPQEDPEVYSMLDSYQPMKMWRDSFIPRFKQDPLSWKLYRNKVLPLVIPYHKSHLTGQKVMNDRLLLVQEVLAERLEGYKARARELTGNDKFNLGGRNDMMVEMYG